MDETVSNNLIPITEEKAVLGALMSADNVMSKIDGILAIDDFGDIKHQWIFEVCLELHQSNIPIDAVTVKNRLEEKGRLSECGGFNALILLADNTPNSERVEHYAKIVSRMSVLRRLVGTAHQIATIATQSQNERLDDIFNNAKGLLDSATPVSTDDFLLMWIDSLSRFHELQLERIDEQEKIERGEITAYPEFAWANVRYYIDHMRPGMFGVVAADSSVGKTSFLEGIAEWNAMRGLNVAFFHLELSHQVMLDRRMCRWAGEPMELIESGEITEKMTRATMRFQTWPGGIHYIHCPGWSIRRIMSYARMLHNKEKCDLIIIDYLQKINLFYRKNGNAELALADVGEVIKTTCEQLKMCSVIGSQMNRKSKDEKRRTSRGIRGSGQIEEKCNVSITIDRDILIDDFQWGDIIYPEGERSPIAKVRIDKNTLGKTGDTKLAMIGSRFWFKDIDLKTVNL